MKPANTHCISCGCELTTDNSYLSKGKPRPRCKPHDNAARAYGSKRIDALIQAGKPLPKSGKSHEHRGAQFRRLDDGTIERVA